MPVKAALAFGLFIFVLSGYFVSSSFLSINKISGDFTVSQPWIEVVSPGVFNLAGNEGGIGKKLATGDELYAGEIVMTDNSGLANIYFPDGSVARLDFNSRLALEEAKFDVENEKLVVRFNLLFF